MSASDENFGTIVKLQRYPQNTQCIPTVEIFIFLDLKQLKTEWSSPLEAWQDAYAHEQLITSRIKNLTTIAREEKDYQAE